MCERTENRELGHRMQETNEHYTFSIALLHASCIIVKFPMNTYIYLTLFLKLSIEDTYFLGTDWTVSV